MKECNWCKSQVDKEAKICPKCGKRIWDKKHKKVIKSVSVTFAIIFLLLFIIIIILALGSPKVEDKCHDAKLANLEEIYELHTKDVKKAEEMYQNKYFKFTGTVSHKYKNYIQIQSNYISSDTYFSTKYEEQANELNVNDKVTYCGKVSFGTSINVKNAMIVKESN